MRHVPLSGFALSAGYPIGQSAAAPGNGVTVVSDSSAPGTSGERVDAIGPAERSGFGSTCSGYPDLRI